MNKEEVIEHLEKLGNGKARPESIDHGICSELHIKMNLTAKELRRIIILSKDWEFYSGSSTYPVPGQQKYIDRARKEFKPIFVNLPMLTKVEKEKTIQSRAASLNYNKHGSLWSGEYGKMRKKLCLFLSEQLKQEQEL